MELIPVDEKDGSLRAHIDRGLWLMFYLSLLLSIVFFIYGIGHSFAEGALRGSLLMVGDMPDTATSAEVLWRDGFFGKVPEFLDGEYVFFGKFPPLHSYLVSLFNYITQDSVISVFIFHLLVFACLVYLFFFRAANYLPFYLRILVLAFLLANAVAGMYFPWYLRPRTELAIVFIALAFLEKMHPAAKGAMFFLAGLTQPVITGLSCGIFFLESFRKGVVAEGFAAIIGMLAASVFYLDLIMNSGSHYLGCASPSMNAYLTLLSILVTAMFLLVKNKTPAQWVCTAGMAISSIDGLLYFIFKKVEFSLLVRVPVISADLCDEVVGGAFIFPFMFILLSKKSTLRENVKRLALLSAIFGLMLSAGIGLAISMGDMEKNYWRLSDALEQMEGGHVATMSFTEYSGKQYLIFQDIILCPTGYLDKRDITFVGTPIPPTYSTYADNYLSQIANDIKNEKGECAEAVKTLGENEVTHLFFAGFEEDATAEELEGCGLEEIELRFKGSRAYRLSQYANYSQNFSR